MFISRSEGFKIANSYGTYFIKMCNLESIYIFINLGKIMLIMLCLVQEMLCSVTKASGNPLL